MTATRKAPRHGRKVTSDDLCRLETTQRTHYLYCPKCHGTYSAEAADYSFYPRAITFKCCRVNNWLIARPSC